MNKAKFELKAVAEMLDVARHRIIYTHRNGFLLPRKRRYSHHWYTPEDDAAAERVGTTFVMGENPCDRTFGG